MHNTRPVLYSLISLTTSSLLACASCITPESNAVNQHLTLEQLATEHRVCAVSVATIRDRKLVSVESAKGCATSSAPQADSIFQAASLSKPVFAYAVLKLVAQGKLDLDAQLMQYLPQGYLHLQNPFNNTGAPHTDLVSDPRIHKVTARMVLTHISGLSNWSFEPLRFESEPGAQWLYSGEGYVLLQRAVEAITKQSLNALMQTVIFEPLGMHHSSYVWDARFEAHIVKGSSNSGETINTLRFEKPLAAATLYTTAEDYGKFVAALLIGTASVDELLHRPVSVDPSLNLSWGLGWGIEHAERETLIWHWGNNPGYRAFVIASTQTGDGFVMLTNSENGLSLAEPLTQNILPGKHALFRFYMLREGLSHFICKTFQWCY